MSSMADQMRNGPRAQQEKMQKAEQARDPALRCRKHPYAQVITGPTIPTGRVRTYCEACHALVPSEPALNEKQGDPS